MTNIDKPRKLRVSVQLIEITKAAPAASIINLALLNTLDSMPGVKAQVRVEELRCNCGDDAWPSYCDYHDKRYGF